MIPISNSNHVHECNISAHEIINANVIWLNRTHLHPLRKCNLGSEIILNCSVFCVHQHCNLGVQKASPFDIDHVWVCVRVCVCWCDWATKPHDFFSLFLLFIFVIIFGCHERGKANVPAVSWCSASILRKVFIGMKNQRNEYKKSDSKKN